MPKFLSPTRVPFFPAPSEADEDGLLAIGGLLTEAWLLAAYERGIFPWFNEGEPILWWNPDPRFVLLPSRVHVAKSMRAVMRDGLFSFGLDTNFAQVIQACADTYRKGQHGTWIGEDMKVAYTSLHAAGWAHSAECYQNNTLVGGLYGVAIGKVFYGESMFSHVSNASKYALIQLCRWLADHNFEFIDCQIYSKHLHSLGARSMHRKDFLNLLEEAVSQPSLQGKWKV